MKSSAEFLKKNPTGQMKKDRWETPVLVPLDLKGTDSAGHIYHYEHFANYYGPS